MLLITGVAGFVGFHIAHKYLKLGKQIIGIDNLNNYYDVSLKEARLNQLIKYKNFQFKKIDILDYGEISKLFRCYAIKKVIHLAAQAGVRFSIENPMTYANSNLNGFMVVLEHCRQYEIEHLVFASTSSVYGANANKPFLETHHTDHPMSLYAATKKANELMAHSYASLYNLPCTGLRFFTVYGPWGRPDMALFKFTKAILDNEVLPVFNNGRMLRDFTYIADVVEGIYRTLSHVAKPNKNWDSNYPDASTSYAPYRIYNIGNGSPSNLLDYIVALEKILGKKAKLEFLPMQAGDVPATHASTVKLKQDIGYLPKVTIEEGIAHFVDWYLDFYK